MDKVLFIIFLIGGSALSILGLRMTDSFGSNPSSLFAGLPTEKAMLMLVIGVFSALIGFVGMSRSEHG